MEEDNPEAFALFAHWVYRGRLGHIEYPNGDDKGKIFEWKLIDLYTLSRKLLLKKGGWLSSEVLDVFKNTTVVLDVSLSSRIRHMSMKTQSQVPSCGAICETYTAGTRLVPLTSAMVTSQACPR